jgi:hypothetical protein
MSVAGAYWRGDEKQTIDSVFMEHLSKKKI